MLNTVIIKPKNWHEFQHYKDRSPSWIKLHKRLLDNYEFQMMPVASRALAPMMWLLSSEYQDAEIIESLDAIAFRMRMDKKEFILALKPLINSSFFECLQDDSGLLADCLPREEKRREEKEKRYNTITNNQVNKSRPKSAKEVEEYAQSIDYFIDGQKFIDHYEANGWMRGKAKIKDWKACVRTWKSNDKGKQPQQQKNSPAEIWVHVLSEIGRVGRMGTPDIDERASKAIDALGGWMELCRKSEKELQFMQGKFASLYNQ